MTETLPFATYHSGSRLLVDDVLLFVTRDRRVFRNWNGTAWKVFPLSELDDREFGFVDARQRIGRLLHTFRAGDVILMRDRSDLPGKNLGFTGSQSTHGSLFPEDSVIPFYVWGEPLTSNVARKARSDSSSRHRRPHGDRDELAAYLPAARGTTGWQATLR